MKKEVAEVRKQFLSKRNLLLVIIGFALILFVISKVGFADFAFSVESIGMKWILATLGITFLIFVVDCFRWKTVLNPFYKTTYFKLFPIFMSGVLFNNITPGIRSGGEVVRAYYLHKRSGKALSDCLAVAVLDAITLGLSFMLLVIFSLVYMIFFLNVSNFILAMLVAVLLVIAIIISFVFYLFHHGSTKGNKRLVKFFGKFYRFKFAKGRFNTLEKFEDFLFDKLAHFVGTFRNLAKRKMLLIQAVLLGFVTFLIMYSRAYILLRLLGVQVGFVLVLAVVTLSYLLGYLIFTPGGFGVVETFMIALYYSQGVTSSIAAAVALIDRYTFFAVALGLGYVSFMYLMFRHNRLPKA